MIKINVEWGKKDKSSLGDETRGEKSERSIQDFMEFECHLSTEQRGFREQKIKEEDNHI